MLGFTVRVDDKGRELITPNWDGADMLGVSAERYTGESVEIKTHGGGIGPNQILSYRPKDLPHMVHSCAFYSIRSVGRSNLPVTLHLAGLHRETPSEPALLIVTHFDARNWKQPWSIAELSRRIVRLGALQSFTWLGQGRWPWRDAHDDDDLGWSIGYYADLPLRETLDRAIAELEQLVLEAERQLAAEVRENTLVATFSFPEAVRVPCEQYLLYFAKFLEDLGVKAEADITHEAGSVLFSVTPKDGKEALGRVREALGLYLQFPNANPGNPAEATLELQSLMANVQHLKGQLYLVTAALQHKDATIGQLNATIETQRLILSGEVMQHSLKQLSAGGELEDKEEIACGLAAITKYKGKGFELNLPEAYRRLKRLLIEEDV